MKKLFVLFAVVALVAAFATTSVAGEWKFYGSARVSGWSIQNDNGRGTTNRNTRFQMQNNTRLGARVSADKLYGRFELGINPDNDAANGITGNNTQANGAGPGVYTRLLYGVWDFGGGKMLVGQDYTSEYLGVSNANNASGSDSVMIGRGTPYGGRKAQIRFEFGEFHIGLIDGTSFSNLGQVDQNNNAALTELTIPKLAAKYTFKFDPVTFDIAGSYLSYDIDRGTLTDLSVDAYMIGARADVKLGPARLRGVGWYAQNCNELGLTTSRDAIAGTNYGGAMVVGAGNAARVIDNDTIGYVITILYQFNDMVGLEAGYGHVEHEMDDASTNNNLAGAPANTGALTEDDRDAYYLQAVIKLAPGVFIMPEAGKDDFKKDARGVDRGDNTYFGAKFQIDF